jgi:integrase
MYKRGGIYYISVGGIRRSAKTRDRERAKRLEHKLNAEAWDRHHGLVIPTWEQAALSWSKSYPKESERYENKKHAKWWLPHLKGKRLTYITREVVHKIIMDNRPGVDLNQRTPKNSTANNYVMFVSRVIRHGSNLNPRFIRYPPIKFRERWLTPEEWFLIKPHLTPDELDVLEFGLATGQRPSNCAFFEWPWDKGDWALIPTSDTKTDKPYGIPLNKTAQAILSRRKKADVKHLTYAFSNNGEAWYALKLLRAVERACKASGVTKITVHGLRHTFASWLAQRGVTKEIRERLMGHSGKDTQDLYTHFDVESLRRYVTMIDTILSQEPTQNNQVAV